MVRRALLAFVLMLGCLSAVALTAPADAAGCVALQAADVRYGAPNLTGQTALGAAEADCYLLPGGTGATYAWAESRPAVRLDFTDANGVQACPRAQEICKLSGPAPYTARVLSEARFPYEMNLLRLDGVDACPAGAVAAFSESSASMLLADAEPLLACRDLELRAGRHLVYSFTDTGQWNLIASDGEDACVLARDPALPEICTVPHAGRYRLVSRHFEDSTPGFQGKRFSVTYLGLGAPGCQPAIDTSWSSPAVIQRVDTYLQIDCHVMPGNPGDRIGAGGDFELGPYGWNVKTEVVDAVGRLACDGNADLAYGCLLQGSPPYRLISRATIGAPFVAGKSYWLAARSVAPAHGCPLVTQATPFNTPEDQLTRGTGCWQYDVAPGEEIRTKVDTVGPRIDYGEENFSGVGGLLGPDFVGRCNYGFCESTTPGRYTIVTSVKGGEHFLGIYNRSDPRGCRPLATDFTTLRGTLAEAQMMCVRLDVPAGRAAGLLLPTREGGSLLSEWYDAAGANICEGRFDRVSRCTTKGPGPYHVVLGGRGDNDYFVSAFDSQAPSTPPQECVTTRLGEPVELILGAQKSTVCFQGGPSETGDKISIERIGGSGRFQVVALTGGGGDSCTHHLEFAATASLRCFADLDGASVRQSFAIVGNGDPATLRVTRSALAPLPSTMTNLRRPSLHGKPWVGRSLTARPGFWSPSNASFFYVWSVNGKRLSVPISRKKLKLLPRYVGKKVRVQVVAVKPGSAPAVAASKPVKVRRKPAR